MKKVYFLFIMFCIALALAACNNIEDSPAAEGSPPQKTEESAAVAAVRAMSDEDFLYNYVNGVELAMFEDFQFADASEIISPQLEHFFMFSLDTHDDAAYAQYEADWLHDDGLFHIPIADIEEQLSRFLKGFSFDATELDDYDAENDEIVTWTISGFGGGLSSKLVSREYNGDVVTATVDFYTDDTFATRDYTKIFTFEFYDDGYYLLSITRSEA